MNRNLSLDLLLYGGALIGLSLLSSRLSAYGGVRALGIGVVGGAACVISGALGMLGYRVRLWAIGLTSILSIALIVEAVLGWLAVKHGVETAKHVTIITTLLSVLAIGQLVNIIQKRSGLIP